MEGFIRRVWGKLVIDKVVIVVKGIFLVRFMSFEFRSKVLEEGILMFEKINGYCLILGCWFWCKEDWYFKGVYMGSFNGF